MEYSFMTIIWNVLFACLKLQVALAATGPVQLLSNLKTTFECNTTAPSYQVCVIHNLLIYNGTNYCLGTDGILEVPQVLMDAPTGKERMPFNCTLLDPSQPSATAMLSTATNSLALQSSPADASDGDEQLDAAARVTAEVPTDPATVADTPGSIALFEYGFVQPRHDLYNYYHVLGENLLQWHYMLCNYLNLCTFSPSAINSTVLSFLDDEPDYIFASVREALTCFSSQPYLLKKQPQARQQQQQLPGQAMLIRRALVGLDQYCYRVGSCFSNSTTKPLIARGFLASWRQRLLDCVGLDAQAAAEQLPRPTITFVQRHLKSHRSILNLPDIVEETQRDFPQYDVKVVHLEDKTLRETAAIFHGSSIVLCFHGAAMANMVFMRPNSTYIDISPPKQKHKFIRYNIENWSPVVGMHYLEYNILDPFDVTLDWRYIKGTAEWKGSSMEDKVRFIEKRDRCPKGANCWVEWMNWKARGAAMRYDKLKVLLQKATDLMGLQDAAPASSHQVVSCTEPQGGGSR